ncbi:MAG TPA: RNA polymerase sigma-70 factor [Puia sp.]|jgi:RNA polymerase sigma-70 factor (ECF subfamily)|nr:RNA polymerase sigma-70 factor [Puia sp.]
MALYPSFPDTRLAALLKEGDQSAYTEIFERYKTILYKHAFRMLQDPDDANDVIQDIFLALWQKRDTLTIKTSLAAYLYHSLRNRIFDRIAHQKVIARYVNSIRDFVEAGQYVADEQNRAEELAAIIEKEIAALPRKMREVFELSRHEDLSYKEIGLKLNISDKTVKQQVYNAVKILRLKVNLLRLFLPFL